MNAIGPSAPGPARALRRGGRDVDEIEQAIGTHLDPGDEDHVAAHMGELADLGIDHVLLAP